MSPDKHHRPRNRCSSAADDIDQMTIEIHIHHGNASYRGGSGEARACPTSLSTAARSAGRPRPFTCLSGVGTVVAKGWLQSLLVSLSGDGPLRPRNSAMTIDAGDFPTICLARHLVGTRRQAPE